MIAAKREADNWIATLALATLAVLTDDQRSKLEAMLAGRDNEEVQQALALVRFANSGASHKSRVKAALARMGGEAVL